MWLAPPLSQDKVALEIQRQSVESQRFVLAMSPISYIMLTNDWVPFVSLLTGRSP